MKSKPIKGMGGIAAVLLIGCMPSILSAHPVEVFSAGDGLDFVHYFGFEHTEEAHERYVLIEDNEIIGGMGKHIELSSSPYPFTQPLTDDVRNKSSTLPIDIAAVLKGTSSAANCCLYFNILNPNDYLHRNLTVQEIDPCNPNDSNNTNPIDDIRSLPIEYDMYKFDAGTFQQNVLRMYRIGVYTKLRGDIYEDGQVDVNDVNSLTEEWLNTTYDSNGIYVGNNYAISDRNHDGFSNFFDFAIVAGDYLKEE